MKITTLISAALLSFSVTGCVVAPAQPYYDAPPGVVYVQPTYVSPGPGYVWGFNANYGWGWRHPRSGWHRGWR
jgi:hypothetical protein